MSVETEDKTLEIKKIKLALVQFFEGKKVSPMLAAMAMTVLLHEMKEFQGIQVQKAVIQGNPGSQEMN